MTGADGWPTLRPMSRVFGAAAVLVLFTGTLSAQSLGEAAAKERQRRERVREKSARAPHVITDDELAANTGRVANESSAPPATAPQAITVPSLPTTSPSSPASSVEAERALQSEREAHWRMEAQRRRHALDSAEAAVQRTARWSDPTYAGADRPSCPIAARSEARRARAALASAQKNLESLEDDARRGGALPGWVR